MRLQVERRTVSKPAYRVPLMSEIADLPWNGFNAISTFSGCGGSSLGYKMAGFRVLWASEFIPAAQQTYRANHPKTILDTRDIRQVKAEEILDAIGMKPGELDLFDGSPPCASFSTAGSREAGWGKVKKYSDGAQRTDDLFYEFIRLVRGIQPKVFIAENVSGLVKGTAKGYFLEILAAMKASGYRVTCRVLDAQWLGVPQQRQRTIFVGVREDLNREPVHPSPLSYRYTVRDALPWIREIRQSGVFNEPDRVTAPSMTAPSMTASGMGAKRNAFVTVEAECDITRFAIGPEWDKIRPGEASKKYFSLQKPHLDKPCPCVTQTAGNTGAAGVCHPTEKRKFSIAELRRICAFPDDFILTGSYLQQWERLGRAVPPVMMSHVAATVRDEILRKI
jgi:DNA (cytosine-5)-methyltransferase 1